MHEKVEAFLQEQRAREAGEDRAQQRETLLRLGLWEKEYAPEGAADLSGYKEQDETGRRWRKVPLSVTEEEWEQIRRYTLRERIHKWSVALGLFSGVFYLLAPFAFFTHRGVVSLMVWAAGGTLLAVTAVAVGRLGKG